MTERPANSAHSVQVHFCAHCRFPHLYLYDEDGHAFAQAVIGQSIVDQLQRALTRGFVEAGGEIQ